MTDYPRPLISSVIPIPEATNINQDGRLTPLKIATAYNMPSSTGANVKVGIISLGGGWWQGDLANSMSNMGLTTPTITTVLVDGASNNFNGNSQTTPGLYSFENTLDLYCVAGLAPSANIVLYIGRNDGINYTTNATTAASLNNNTSFGNLITRAVDEECDIISISWASGEILSNVYPNYYCGDFLAGPLAAASAKGISVFASSGDYGSIFSLSANIETAVYPATSSNVIAVGGTNLIVTTGNVRSSETVENLDPIFSYANGYGSGGGISTFISLPTWQSNLTYQRYFKSNSTVGPVTSLSNRGVPDIAAPMNSYGLWYGNVINQFGGGTSASAPIMAGMFARFMSLNGGRRPIPNAIHPILYGNLNAYYDITSGNNATTTYLNGYAASSNWDPITGVGVPWGNVVYQMVSSGGTTVKTAANNWSYLANVKVKTATNTWSNVRAIWTKVDSTTWKQTF